MGTRTGRKEIAQKQTVTPGKDPSTLSLQAHWAARGWGLLLPALLCMGCKRLIPTGRIPHRLGPPSSWLGVAFIEGGVWKTEARVRLPICSSGGISDGSRASSVTLVPAPLPCHGPSSCNVTLKLRESNALPLSLQPTVVIASCHASLLPQSPSWSLNSSIPCANLIGFKCSAWVLCSSLASGNDLTRAHVS